MCPLGSPQLPLADLVQQMKTTQERQLYSAGRMLQGQYQQSLLKQATPLKLLPASTHGWLVKAPVLGLHAEGRYFVHVESNLQGDSLSLADEQGG